MEFLYPWIHCQTNVKNQLASLLKCGIKMDPVYKNKVYENINNLTL